MVCHESPRAIPSPSNRQPRAAAVQSGTDVGKKSSRSKRSIKSLSASTSSRRRSTRAAAIPVHLDAIGEAHGAACQIRRPSRAAGAGSRCTFRWEPLAFATLSLTDAPAVRLAIARPQPRDVRERLAIELEQTITGLEQSGGRPRAPSRRAGAARRRPRRAVVAGPTVDNSKASSATKSVPTSRQVLQVCSMCTSRRASGSRSRTVLPRAAAAGESRVPLPSSGAA